MTSNFEQGTAQIYKEVASGLRQLICMSNRLTNCSSAVQNHSKKDTCLAGRVRTELHCSVDSCRPVKGDQTLPCGIDVKI